MPFKQRLIWKLSSTAGIPSISVIVLFSLNQAACSPESCVVSDTKADRITLTSISTPLSDNAYRAIIRLPFPAPTNLKAGQRQAIHFLVRNAGAGRWPSTGEAGGKYQIRLGNHWLDENHQAIIADDGRSELPYDIELGGEVELLLLVTAPKTPGKYILALDMVQEQVAWFAEKGSGALELTLRVE